ncbi:MAG: hypothetical protein P1U86_14980 [Verrucomicrobiales bacterium]|nr:hypothetical protein [Verrucomicrobiales bacterium]
MRSLLLLSIFLPVVATQSSHADDIPSPLVEAFSIIDRIVPEATRERLTQVDKRRVRPDPFTDDVPDDVTKEKTYDDLRGGIVEQIQKEMMLGPRHPSLSRAPKHREIESFFVPYFVPFEQQPDLLLEFYVRHIRGMPIHWKRTLVERRDENLHFIGEGWRGLLYDIRSMERSAGLELIKKLRESLDETEKKIAEQDEKYEGQK